MTGRPRRLWRWAFAPVFVLVAASHATPAAPRTTIPKGELVAGRTHRLTGVAAGTRVAVRLAWSSTPRNRTDTSGWTYRIVYEVAGQQYELAIRDREQTIPAVHQAARIHVATDDEFETTIRNVHATGSAPNELQLAMEDVSGGPTVAGNAQPLEAPRQLQIQATGHTTWEAVSGAEAYELQWTFVDADDRFQANTPFHKRPTGTIEVQDTSADLELGYGAGTVYVRVRALGRYAASVTVLRGAWATAAPLATSALDEARNWYRTTRFDQQGTNRTTITHYDAVLRAVQQIDTSRPAGITRVTQTVLDDEGRAALTTLPIPVTVAATANPLSFNANFAVPQNATVPLSSAELRTGESPDGTLQVDKPPPLATSGAGAYFAQRAVINLAEGAEERWIPEESRPYTSVVFARDLRGRPVRSNGIGSVLHDHPATFISGSAGVEFRQVFGASAGLLAKYARGVSIDPNEQGHVRYTDPDGRLVAVGLVGKAPSVIVDPTTTPASLEPALSRLDDNPLPGGPVVTGRIEIPPSRVEPERRSTEYVHTLVNSASTDYTFAYKLAPTTTQVSVATTPPSTTCPDCRYTTTIRIIDPFGAVVPCGTVTKGACNSDGNSEGKYTVTVGAPNTCSPTAGEIEFSVTLARLGEYRVIRRVDLDDSAVQNFVEAHETDIPGAPAVEDVRQHVDTNSSNPCALSDCADDAACTERLVRAAAENECKGLEALAVWERQQAAIASCDQQRAADASIACGSDVAAEAGYTCPPYECPVPGDSKACCHARRCTASIDATVRSRLYDLKLARITGWPEADNAKVLDPLATGDVDRPQALGDCTTSACRDPIFFSPDTAVLRSTMRARLRDYKDDPCDPSKKLSLWEYVSLPLFGFDDATRWAVLRGAYLALRAELLVQWVNTPRAGCPTTPGCCGDNKWCPYNDVVKAPDLTAFNATVEETLEAALQARTNHCAEQCAANVCNWRWQLEDGLCPAYHPFDANDDGTFDFPAYTCDASTPTDAVHDHLLEYCLRRCNGAFDASGAFSATDIASDPDLIAAAAAARGAGGQSCDFDALAGAVIEPSLVCKQDCKVPPSLTPCGRVLVWYLESGRRLDRESLYRELKIRATDCPELQSLRAEKAELLLEKCRIWLVDPAGQPLSFDGALTNARVDTGVPGSMPAELRSMLTGIVVETAQGRTAYLVSDCRMPFTKVAACCPGSEEAPTVSAFPDRAQPTAEQVCAGRATYRPPTTTSVLTAVRNPEKLFACVDEKTPTADPAPGDRCSEELLARIAAVLAGSTPPDQGECAGLATVHGSLIRIESKGRKDCWFELLAGDKPAPWLDQSGWRIAAIENAPLPSNYPSDRSHNADRTSFRVRYSGLRLVLEGPKGTIIAVYLYSTCPLYTAPACDPVGGKFEMTLEPFDFGTWSEECQATAEEFEDAQTDRLFNEGTEDATATWTSTLVAHCMGGDLGETFTVAYQAAEYAHTLFYYDQAGNLSAVVPPKGVKKLTVTGGTMNETQIPLHEMLTRVEYDARNNIVRRVSPDAGSATFVYDSRGRRRFAQTSEQRDRQEWSYADYDALDRVVETGLSGPYADVRTYVDSGLPAGARRDERVVSSYGPPDWTGGAADAATYTRGRVRQLFASLSETTLSYTYSFTGHVRSFTTDQPALGRKVAQYGYDPVDDSLLAIDYQPSDRAAARSVDEVHQRYSYDVERRLVLAESSLDGVLWDRDVRYAYYRHGPLRRATLGEDQVQGLDYVHTIHGWPKAVNGGDGSSARDPGSDGKAGGAHAAVAQDLVGLVFSYFPGDFASPDTAFMTGDAGTAHVFARDGPGLFTGLIRNRLLTHRALDAAGTPERLRYNYDQLGRLTDSLLTGTGPATAVASAGCYALDVTTAIRHDANGFPVEPSLPAGSSCYRYDPNGNLTLLKRWGTGARCAGAFDRLAYSYDTTNNRLLHIDDDGVANTACDADIDDQGTFQAATTGSANYGYDAVGRLIRDTAEGIVGSTDAPGVTWSGTDKVLGVLKLGVPALTFGYDGLDRRTSKASLGATDTVTTFYLRHPDGQILATYKATNPPSDIPTPVLSEFVLYAGRNRIGTRLPHMSSATDVAETARGLTQYQLVDQVGSVLATVTGAGDVASAADYYPFGMLRPGRETGFGNSRFGFGGYEKDDELKRLGASYITDARFYDPRVGRWLSPDPLFVGNPAAAIEKPLDINHYAYGRNNPVLMADTDGQLPIIPVILGAIWVADKVYAAYEAYEDYRAIETGEKTVGDVATARGIEMGLGLAMGPVGRVGGKLVRKVGGDILERVGKEALDEGAERLAKKADDLAPTRAAADIKPGQVASAHPQGRPVGGRGEGVRVTDPPAGTREAEAFDLTPENLARMEKGRPPIGRDGLPVELHHRGQNPAGPLDEMTSKTHDTVAHPASPSQIDRGAFAGERARHWRERARELLGQGQGQQSQGQQ